MTPLRKLAVALILMWPVWATYAAVFLVDENGRPRCRMGQMEAANFPAVHLQEADGIEYLRECDQNDALYAGMVLDLKATSKSILAAEIPSGLGLILSRGSTLIIPLVPGCLAGLLGSGGMLHRIVGKWPAEIALLAGTAGGSLWGVALYDNLFPPATSTTAKAVRRTSLKRLGLFTLAGLGFNVLCRKVSVGRGGEPPPES